MNQYETISQRSGKGVGMSNPNERPKPFVKTPRNRGSGNDLNGKRFGFLKALYRIENDSRIHGRYSFWLCKCDCGNEKVIRKQALLDGRTIGCGCRSGGVKHGKSKTKTFKVWYGMINRCKNPNYAKYRYWGGRGISVCERWKNNFENFLEDMGEAPNGLSIDRINNNGNYEPGNCRWATWKQQERNRSISHLITFGGETLCIAEWAEKMNISYSALSHRICSGWSIKKALTTPTKLGFTGS